MITFNGEKFIIEQLKSILNQSVQPNEVLIFDDNSQDNTLNLILQFINNNNLQNWKVYKNNNNLGWIQNCLKALDTCKTDIIFWSDQDDIWYPEKIQKMVYAKQKFNCHIVYSSWDYIDSNGKSMNLFTGERTGKLIKIDPYNKSTKTPPLLGCSSCFSKQLSNILISLASGDFNSPDWLMYRLGISLNSVIFVDSPLFSRRIHENNVTSSKKTLYRTWFFSFKKHKKMISVLRCQKNMLSKIICDINKLDILADTSYIQLEFDFLKKRIEFLEDGKHMCSYIKTSFRINSFSDFINSFLKDVLFVICRSFSYL